MLPSFDVLRVTKDGAFIWCSEASTLEDAKAQIKILAELESEFVIFDHRTYESVRIKPTEVLSAQ